MPNFINKFSKSASTNLQPSIKSKNRFIALIKSVHCSPVSLHLARYLCEKVPFIFLESRSPDETQISCEAFLLISPDPFGQTTSLTYTQISFLWFSRSALASTNLQGEKGRPHICGGGALRRQSETFLSNISEMASCCDTEAALRRRASPRRTRSIPDF